MTRTVHDPAFYPKGTFTVGNRLDPDSVADGAPAPVASRHGPCPGCGERLAARHIAGITAAMGRCVHVLDGAERLPDILGCGDDGLHLFYDHLATVQGALKIALSGAIAYVASASVADINDLRRKVAKALGLRGVRYVHVHAPCPRATGASPRDTIRLARLAAESGLFAVVEAENGAVTASRKIRHRVPVADFLRLAPRSADHLAPGDTRLAELQAMADRNIVEFHLLGRII